MDPEAEHWDENEILYSCRLYLLHYIAKGVTSRCRIIIVYKVSLKF